MDVSRLYRLLKLISSMRSGRRLDADGLAKELDVSRRTLFRDLNLLERAGVPYQFEPRTNSYTISDRFFLPALHLGLDEAMALLLVTRKFLSEDVHPMHQYAVDAALKIESSLPRVVQAHCGSWLSGVSIRWPAASATDAVGSTFRTLQRAVADRIRVRLEYESVTEGEEIQTVLEPFHMVFMARGWYVIGWSQLHSETRTFKLDRIVKLSQLEDRFEARDSFSLDTYFGSAWQMIPDGTLYDVRLRFDATVAATVEEVIWHASQRTERLADNRLLFEARVDGLREIAAWVLGYGDAVEVLAPIELRRIVRDRAMRIVERATELDAEGAL